MAEPILRMTRSERWLQHVAVFLVGVTGVVYLILLYLIPAPDPYAVVHHPWQPHVQHLHLLVAPLLVFSAGQIWAAHAAEKLRRSGGSRRRSGLLLVLGLLPMIVSGYLLQIAVEERWREAWAIVHAVTSSLWLLGYVAHLVTSAVRRAWGRRRSS